MLWPRLPSLRRSTAQPPLEAALSYAVGLQWPVLPGCGQGRSGPRCGWTDCVTAAPHPATGGTGLTPSVDESAVRRWWRRRPQAPVLLAVGHRFDLLDVPAGLADQVLASVRATGYRLGPVVHTVGERLLIWVRAGTAGQLAAVGGAGPGAVALRGLGDYVMVPPEGGSWVIAPVPLNQPTLPHCADILAAVNRVCGSTVAHPPAPPARSTPLRPVLPEPSSPWSTPWSTPAAGLAPQRRGGLPPARHARAPISPGRA